MKILTVFLVFILSVCLLARQIRVTYFGENFNPASVTVTIGKDDDVLRKLFEKLATPPSGLKTLVPQNILNAYFFVETALILDLKSSGVRTFDFDQERYFLHQVLFNIFDNFKTLTRVYIIIDGKRTEVMSKYVDIRYSFPREIWSNWPVEIVERE